MPFLSSTQQPQPPPPARRRTDELWFPARHRSRHNRCCRSCSRLPLASSIAAVNLPRSSRLGHPFIFSGIIALPQTPDPIPARPSPAQEAGQLSDSTNDPVASRWCRKTAAPKPPKPSVHLASPESPLTQAPFAEDSQVRTCACSSSVRFICPPRFPYPSSAPSLPPSTPPRKSRARTQRRRGRQRATGSAFHMSSSLPAGRAFFEDLKSRRRLKLRLIAARRDQSRSWLAQAGGLLARCPLDLGHAGSPRGADEASDRQLPSSHPTCRRPHF